ncbi:hypothetical protein CB0940_12007 [Cercospora beticola]|uniref:Cupin type-1 domain-containing protein n=1 Tax=Cercospora beticola TaxID=122368 RepID=A0A2G5IDH6_CERBT|nr:hypothetical protein CB0940_12007 [Cercospora beticola]PIB02898.1 hypothetical protein CB0940_12007 [Cercospora beticola]WPB04388.1 hypothetical protein RHO25_009034 [Cercospora beticola]CAK1356785.1 unnamed protein product [Cercospora beticola]
MKAGDVAVHAAGVAHRNVESSEDYEYAGFYPEGAPHWDNNFCKADKEETEMKKEAARKIAVPDCDPIYGKDGPLPRIWNKVDKGPSFATSFFNSLFASSLKSTG